MINNHRPIEGQDSKKLNKSLFARICEDLHKIRSENTHELYARVLKITTVYDKWWHWPFKRRYLVTFRFVDNNRLNALIERVPSNSGRSYTEGTCFEYFMKENCHLPFYYVGGLLRVMFTTLPSAYTLDLDKKDETILIIDVVPL